MGIFPFIKVAQGSKSQTHSYTFTCCDDALPVVFIFNEYGSFQLEKLGQYVSKCVFHLNDQRKYRAVS